MTLWKIVDLDDIGGYHSIYYILDLSETSNSNSSDIVSRYLIYMLSVACPAKIGMSYCLWVRFFTFPKRIKLLFENSTERFDALKAPSDYTNFWHFSNLSLFMDRAF